MMKIQIFLLLSWAGVILAVPARTDCGEVKSFIGTNLCGETYGGTWTECATGVSDVPTFIMPSCTPTPASGISPGLSAVGPGKFEYNVTTTEPVGSMITIAPSYKYSSVPNMGNLTTSCSPLFICIDYLDVCGGHSTKYGDCYDTCTPHSRSSIECTLPPVSTTAPVRYLPTATNSDHNATYQAPVREKKPWCVGASFMCAPKGWF